jgi:hypothetical protein
MRSMIFAAMTAAVAMTMLALPAQAAVHHRHARLTPYGGDTRSGGFGTGSYWQREPTDHRSIWRYAAQESRMSLGESDSNCTYIGEWKEGYPGTGNCQ